MIVYINLTKNSWKIYKHLSKYKTEYYKKFTRKLDDRNTCCIKKHKLECMTQILLYYTNGAFCAI